MIVPALLRLGAIIVAKAKTVQLASGPGPRYWIDYQCPLNPRRDGYLDPDCSSTGSAAGVAEYNWLDFSIGSDSECFLINPLMFSIVIIEQFLGVGSLVGPVVANGIFGLRSIHGVLTLEGSLFVLT